MSKNTHTKLFKLQFSGASGNKKKFTDRHTNNFGLLRDVKTGKLLGLAPNYDNNMALISHGYPSTPKSGDLLIRLLGELMDKHPEYKEYIPTLTENMVRSVLTKLNMRVKMQAVVDIVMGRYKLIKK